MANTIKLETNPVNDLTELWPPVVRQETKRVENLVEQLFSKGMTLTDLCGKHTETLEDFKRGLRS